MSRNSNGSIVRYETTIKNSGLFMSSSFPVPSVIQDGFTFPEVYIEAKMMKSDIVVIPIVTVTVIMYDIIKANLQRFVDIESENESFSNYKMVDPIKDMIEYNLNLKAKQGYIRITGTAYYIKWHFDSEFRVHISHNFASVTLDSEMGVIPDRKAMTPNKIVQKFKAKIDAINRRVAKECTETKIENEFSELSNQSELLKPIYVRPTSLKKQ
jgi:hypothetical protein